MENFSLVVKGVYRSAFPKKKNFSFLKRLKLKSILTLILEDYPDQNQKFLDENGTRLFQFGVAGNKDLMDLPEEIICEALSVILDQRNHPLLIHCNKGKHRTGCLVGCIRKIQHWSFTSIFEEYRRFSHPKSRTMDQQFIELFELRNVVADPKYLPDWPEVQWKEGMIATMLVDGGLQGLEAVMPRKSSPSVVSLGDDDAVEDEQQVLQEIEEHYDDVHVFLIKLEMESKVVGILGGGQLGRMLVEAANRLNVSTLVLDMPGNPASQVSGHHTKEEHVLGSFKDAGLIAKLAAKCDVLTVEIEHVDTAGLDAALAQGLVAQVHPLPSTIRTIQDKFLQKQHLIAHNVPVAESREVSSAKDIQDAVDAFGNGFPVMLKSKTLAYDGRGNRVIKSASEIPTAITDLGGGPANNGPALYVEKWVPFTRELAVMVARSVSGTVASYPCVETVQKNNVCHVVVAPAQIDGLMLEKARVVAENAVKSFEGAAGIFGVEMFLLENGDIILNELAPRPHNSGHYTIEACHTSQYEQHIRAILDMPLGSTALKVPASIMINLLGSGPSPADMESSVLTPCRIAMETPGVSVHLYGKAVCQKGRKMGHITLTADSMPEAASLATKILTSMGDGVDPSTLKSMTPSPVVGIIMGSDSDLPHLKAAAQILTDFGVPFELTVVSAHRTPHRMVTYAETARTRGLKVIIAAAGGAAHLPGMVAALTTLPVIGVPVALRQLDGVDSLYSICQMPRGVPVATVAIGNSTNAALLAVRMLGVAEPKYLDKIEAFAKRSEAEVLGKVEVLEKVGWKDYEVKH
ncbi:phosphoribosylaminoimidazole carboxylase ade2 [Podochytrium sp. JEL0797]|nr:phosphoribosylaminoimidazole carboxylase ade2 [Podochytrium sp. JEL0797]